MAQTCPTVRVKAPVSDDNPSGYVVINESDVTEAHKLFDTAPAGDQFDAMPREELRAYLSQKKIDFGGNTGDARLRTLAREAT